VTHDGRVIWLVEFLTFPHYFLGVFVIPQSDCRFTHVVARLDPNPRATAIGVMTEFRNFQ